MGASIVPPSTTAPEEAHVYVEGSGPEGGGAPVGGDAAPTAGALHLDPLEDAPTDLRPALVPPAAPSEFRVPRPRDLLAPMSPEEFDEVPLRPSSPGELAADAARRSIAPGEVEE